MKCFFGEKDRPDFGRNGRFDGSSLLKSNLNYVLDSLDDDFDF